MNEHILVIDDDELVRTGLAANLERAGYRVSTAAGGEEGVRVAIDRRVDLALCDLVLGDADGIDVLRRIKTDAPATSVIMITGHGSIKNALDALRCGASDYLQKPADPDEVIHRIRTVLDSLHLRNTLAAERQRAENRKREITEQLARAERMSSIGLLAEGAAEDLGAILDPMSELVTRLEADGDRAEERAEAVSAIREILERARLALDDLRAIATSSTPDAAEINLNHLVDRFMKSDSFGRIKKHHAKVRLDVDLAAMLPPLSGSVHQLETVIANLVANACESMPTGGVVHIETSSQHIDRPSGRFGSGAPGDYVLIRITDSGSGLSPADVERIFEPFYVRTVLGRTLVSGLGMTLVHRVVEDHGGFIDVNTQAGQGTTFTVYLPVQAQGGTLELKADYTGRETLLLVDDSEEHRTIAADLLRDLGYRVLAAATGQEAVSIFESAMRSSEEHIDLVVIDLVLGDVFDGLETYKALLERRPGLKAVMVSGFADIARIVEARKLGLRQCIRKPYALDPLGKAVRSELDQ